MAYQELQPKATEELLKDSNKCERQHTTTPKKNLALFCGQQKQKSNSNKLIFSMNLRANKFKGKKKSLPVGKSYYYYQEL